MRLTELALWLRGKRLANPALLNRKPADARPRAWIRARYDFTSHEVKGRVVLTARPRGRRTGPHIIYLHGGGYVWPLIRPHWWVVDRLIRATGGPVSVPLYPLAPESDHREAFEFLVATYRDLLDAEPSARPVLAGDSAGGGLALGLAVKLREAGLPLPSHLILFSPWLDLTLADPAAREVEPWDAMLGIGTLRHAGELWANDADLAAPHLSPLHADLHGLPSIQLFQGSHDLLAVDARTFARRAEACGHPIEYVEVSGAIHNYIAATWTRESRDAFQRIGAVLRRDQRLVS